MDRKKFIWCTFNGNSLSMREVRAGGIPVGTEAEECSLASYFQG